MQISPDRTYDVTATVVNYNGGERLLQTLASLRAQRNVKLQVLVFDDGSTDGSAELARQSGLADKVFISDVNTKYANRWRAAGMEAATTDLVFVCDNDLEFDESCLAVLAGTFDQDPTIAAVTPAIYDSEDPEKAYSYGSLPHFLGLTIRRENCQERIVDSVGTGITMYAKSRLDGVGYYDATYPMGWGSDGEFHQRIRLAGLRSVVNRDARILHEFKPFSDARSYRLRGATRNRLTLIGTHYSLGTLLFLLPLLIAFEVFLLFFYLGSGLRKPYWEGIKLFASDLPACWRRRKFIQGMRRRPDWQLLVAGEVFMPPHVRLHKWSPVAVLLRAGNAAVSAYWDAYVWICRLRH
jgi:GT2 family glycosyltransferase